MSDLTDPRDILLSPVISEKSYGLLDENKYTFLVRPDANKTQIKIAVEKVFGVKVERRQHAQPPGQAQAHPGRLRPARRHQARDRHAARGPHRDLRGPGRLAGPDLRGRGTDMGIRKYKPTTPGRRGSSRRRLRRGHARHAGEVAGPPAAQQGRPQRLRARHHPPPGWRPQARLPRHRLPSPRQGRRAGQGRAHRVRPQPHRAHRAAALRRRREALHRGAATA